MRLFSRKPIVPGVYGQPDSFPKGFQEKLLASRVHSPVPQTDTGGRGEYPKVLE